MCIGNSISIKLPKCRSCGQPAGHHMVKIVLAEKIDVFNVEEYILDILFPSNHNIHKSLYGLCFWASDLLIDRFY